MHGYKSKKRQTFDGAADTRDSVRSRYPTPGSVTALNLEKLAMQADARWSDYDRQWNMIKPAQQRIDLAMERLEGTQASLSPAERQAVAQTKRDVDEIANTTQDLWIRIGQQTVDLKAPALRADARRLDKATRELIKAVNSAS